MINKNNIFITLIIIFLSSVCFFINIKSEKIINYKKPLVMYLNNISDWKINKSILMDAKVESSLELDDYLFQTYTDGKDVVTLYIGYYYSAKKVGAAHDPIVCFPGQGWQVTKNLKGVYKTKTQGGDTLKYATINARLGEEVQYILYWFQAFDEPANNTFIQKIKLLQKGLQGKGQDNAFVRISMPCTEKDSRECERTLLSFANDFYPLFLKYITSN